MGRAVLVLITLFLFSCRTGNEVSKDELNELKMQVKYLNEKVDSLESQLDYKYDVENLLRHDDSLLFSYKRTPCYGNCPVFEFKVYQDGWASYRGSNFVDMMGIYTANLTYEQMLRIKKIFSEAHYYAFRNKYDDDRLDIPAMIIEYHGPQGVKKVLARTNIPHSFRTMAEDLEVLADDIKWYPVE